MEKTITIKSLILFFGSIIIVIGLITCSYLIGYHKGATNQKVKIDNKSLTYSDLIKKIDSYSTEVKKQQDLLKNLQSDIDIAKADKEILEKRNADLDKESGEKQSTSQKTATNTSIVTKQTTRSLSAGSYIIGKDIATGRYKIDSQGKTGGFFLYDSSGRQKDSAFFSPYTSTSYELQMNNGEKLVLQSPAKLIPIK